MRTLCFLTVALLAACSPRVTTIGENVDGGPALTLSLSGQVCTAAPDATAFPVKLVLLIDQSGMSCVIDPPGSQGSPGFCEMYGTVPPGVTQPSRVRGLNRLMSSLSTRPDVTVAMVPYETNVKGVWPWPPSGPRFARPDGTLSTRINTLQAELGNMRDIQGALQYAYGLVASDVIDQSLSNPEVLANTRYVVVLLSNGPPLPRCSHDDSLPRYADDLSPFGMWPDSDSAYCNLIDPMDPDAITGFRAGGDRNQDPQLAALVDDLIALEATHHVGDIRLDTILFTNDESIRNCGAQCDNLFGARVRWPGPVPVADGNAFAKVEAQSLMQLLAERGGGSFTEFADFAGLAQFGVQPIADLGSFASLNVQRALFVQPTMSVAWEGQWEVDADGDGLPDPVEATLQSNPHARDTDGDGFSDGFEYAHATDGFSIATPDARGCIPTAPNTLNCTSFDSDGDGLTQWEERVVGTSSVLVDTDRDGIPDGLEVRWGLDPLSVLPATFDSDGDGVSDFDEVQRATDPHFADAQLSSITVSSQGQVQSNNALCLDYTVSGLPMLETPAFSDVPAGVAAFKVWFAEAPSLAPQSPGRWKVTCALARRDLAVSPPRLVPAELQGTLFAGDFVQGAQLSSFEDFRARCRFPEALQP